MPKLSNGLEYFDIQTNIMDDKRIKLLKAEFGITGFGIWVELLRQIYADEGYFLLWDKDTQILFADDVGQSGGLVDEVVKGSVRRGLFHEPVFNQFKVLTSKHIQEKYFKAIKRRSTEVEIDGRFLVIDRNTDIISGNVNIKLLNVDIKIQRREEKRKEEKRREEDIPENPEFPHYPDEKTFIDYGMSALRYSEGFLKEIYNSKIGTAQDGYFINGTGNKITKWQHWMASLKTANDNWKEKNKDEQTTKIKRNNGRERESILDQIN